MPSPVCHFATLAGRLATIVLTVASVCGTSRTACAQEPAVHRIEPTGVQAGQEASLTVFGERLQNAVALWTAVGSLRPAADHDAAADKTVTFHGPISAEAQTGILPARVMTTTGCSAEGYLVVDGFAAVAAPATSESAESPALLSVPGACSGQVNPVKPRFFTISLKAGQRVAIETVARRLDSDLDAVLTVTDANGSEVAFCDDVPGLEGDAIVQFEARADGDFRIELRDIRYSGGPRHFFYLRIAESPLFDAFIQTQTSRVTQAESEPNETQDQATVVAAETQRIAGGFAETGDVDWYRIHSETGGPLCITARTRESGSAADVVLRLIDSQGNVLQESDETGPHDAQLAHALSGGDFFLEVRELGTRGGPQWHYSLELDRQPRIEVTLPADHLTVPRGGSVSIPMTVKRLLDDRPLTLSVENLPPGITSPPVVIPPRQTTVPLVLSAAADTDNQPAADRRSLQVAANASGDPPVTVITSIAPPERKKQNGPFRSFRLRSDVFCAAGPAPEFSVRPEPDTLSIAAGSAAELSLRVTRHADWPVPVSVAPAVPAEQLPAGLMIPAVAIEGESGQMTISVPADAAAEEMTLFLQGTATKEKQTVTHAIPPVRIRITRDATQESQ